MAREMKKRVSPFGLENSDAIDENERILAAGRQQRKENREKVKASGEKADNTAPAPSSINADAPASSTRNTDTPAPSVTNVESLAPSASVSAPSVSAPVAQTPSTAQTSAKATSGIVVDVPIDDYMALMQMKVMTRRTLKDLALQAIHEFVKRNK